MNANDGGPAFPRPASKGNNYLTGEANVVVDPQMGMSLRDYFAAQALNGWYASYTEMGSDDIPITDVAKFCYRTADAMLKAR